MICPNCGYNAKDTDKFCVRCATRLIPDMPEVEQQVNAAAEAFEDKAEAAFSAAEEHFEAAGERTVDEINGFAHDATVSLEHAADNIEAKAEAVFEQDIPKPYVPAAPERPYEPVVKPYEPYVQPVVQPVQPAEPVQPVRETEVQHTECCSKLTKPLTTWGFLWRLLLFMIPIFNIIPLFVMAFSSGINKNSRGLSRAVLILLLIGFVLAAAGIIYLLVAYGTDWIGDYLTNLWNAIKTIGK